MSTATTAAPRRTEHPTERRDHTGSSIRAAFSRAFRRASAEADETDTFEGLLRHAATAGGKAPADTRLGAATLRLAIIRTPGVPDSFDGTAPAIEEIARRLRARGHQVTLLGGADRRGIVGSGFTGRRYDAALVFDVPSTLGLPRLALRGTPVAVHLSALAEKGRRHGGRLQRIAAARVLRNADALIGDTQHIVDSYRDTHGVRPELLTFGADRLRDVGTDSLTGRGLEPGRFHLVVADLLPENSVDLIVDGYTRSKAQYPLVVIGSATRAGADGDHIAAAALADPRIRMLSDISNEDELDQLFAHARTYLHGHTVGGISPSLLRAMGAATAVIAYDMPANREAAGPQGLYFRDVATLAPHLHELEIDAWQYLSIGRSMQDRAVRLYNWEAVVTSYETLALRLATGVRRRPTAR